MEAEDVVVGVMFASVTAVVLYVIVAICIMIPAENYCVERGWAGANVTFSFKKFCYFF